MRGNCRTSGTLRKEEGGNVFGLGSRTPIALTLLVKKPTTEQQKAKIYYHEIGSFLTKEQKLAELKRLGSVLNEQLLFSSITPSEDHDWINKKDDLFQTFIPLGDKKNEEVKTIFVPFYSLGCATARDVWCYNFSKNELAKNMASMIEYYNKSTHRTEDVDFEYDSKKISWSHGLKEKASRNIIMRYDPKCVTYSMYRPFCKEFFFYYKPVIQRTYQISKIFPDPQIKNLVICVSGIAGNKELSVLISSTIVDLNCLHSGTQCFPLYYYEKNDSQQSDLYTSSQDEYIRHDGISDFALNLARELNPKITKEDIFYYIYGFLHNQEYRARFAADLKKSLPRIFFPATYEEFRKYCEAGRHLAKLHLNYESGPLCPSVVVLGCEHGNFKVDKMRFIAKDDKRTIIFNNDITIENIPQEAYNYVINGKSAIEWIMERYAITIDKNSKIVNDPNQWSEDPRYVLDLLLRIIQMSLETLKIVNKLPKLNLPS
ncbi:MAG: type ISP restriction/modification enzyme [Candidatus Bruticola sp.]